MSRIAEQLGYPDAPGYKVEGPSRSAAQKMNSTAAKLRAAVEVEFQRHPTGLTADEIATTLDLSVLSVRPRVSELRRNGRIEPTGIRRTNQSGMSATVWKLILNRPVGA